MAWLGQTLGDPSEFITSYSPGGSDQSPACFYSEGSGARVVGVGDATVSGDQYLKVEIFKGGSSFHSATNIKPSGGYAWWRQRFISVGKYVFYPYFNGYNIQIRKLDLTDGSYTTPFEEATGGSTTYVQLDMIHDPDGHYIYLVTRTSNSKVRAWKIDEDGVNDHRILDLSGTRSYPSIGVNNDDGKIYIGGASGSTWYYGSVTISDTDASSITAITSNTASTGAYVIGLYGLHFQHGNYTLYTADHSSDSWDLSSYLDSELRITLLRKDSGSHTYYAFCATGNVLYLLRLSPGSSVTEIDSISIDSNHNPTWPDSNLYRYTTIRQASDMKLGQNPLYSGQGTNKKMMIYKPPDRDVI